MTASGSTFAWWIGFLMNPKSYLSFGGFEPTNNIDLSLNGNKVEQEIQLKLQTDVDIGSNSNNSTVFHSRPSISPKPNSSLKPNSTTKIPTYKPIFYNGRASKSGLYSKDIYDVDIFLPSWIRLMLNEKTGKIYKEKRPTLERLPLEMKRNWRIY